MPRHADPNAPVGTLVPAAEFGRGTPDFERHSHDAWQMAEPVPMAATTRASLRGLIRAICPTLPDAPDIEERVELHVRRMMRYMPALAALGLHFAFHLLDWAPRFLGRSMRRLRGMDRAQAQRVMERLGHIGFTPVRLVLYGVRGLILSTFFDQDEAYDAIGYRPVPFLQERVQLRQRLLAGVDPTTRDVIAVPERAL